MADSSFGLTDDLIKDIADTFRGSANIYRYLGTNNKVWDGKILQKVGVKFVTARDIAAAYMIALKNIRHSVINGSGAVLAKASYYYDKYEANIANGYEVSDFVIRLSDAAHPSVTNVTLLKPRE